MSLIEKIDAEIERLNIEFVTAKSAEQKHLISAQAREAVAIKQLILSEQKEPLTVGDKIRESNESLAEFISNYNISCGLCENRFNRAKCDSNSCVKGIEDYLNQPYTES